MNCLTGYCGCRGTRRTQAGIAVVPHASERSDLIVLFGRSRVRDSGAGIAIHAAIATRERHGGSRKITGRSNKRGAPAVSATGAGLIAGTQSRRKCQPKTISDRVLAEEWSPSFSCWLSSFSSFSGLWFVCYSTYALRQRPAWPELQTALLQTLTPSIFS